MSLRYHLGYHTAPQVLWGLGFGVLLGGVHYTLTEHIPRVHPSSLPGRARRAIVDSKVAMWMRVVDGWAVWADGGHEASYQQWRAARKDKHL